MIRKIILLMIASLAANAQKDSITDIWGFMAGINLTEAYSAYNRTIGSQGGSSGFDYEKVNGKGKSSNKYAFNTGFIFTHRKKPYIKFHVGYMASVFQFNYSHSWGYSTGSASGGAGIYGPGYYGHTDKGTGTIWRNCVRLARYYYTDNKIFFFALELVGCSDNISIKGQHIDDTPAGSAYSDYGLSGNSVSFGPGMTGGVSIPLTRNKTKCIEIALSHYLLIYVDRKIYDLERPWMTSLSYHHFFTKRKKTR